MNELLMLMLYPITLNVYSSSPQIYTETYIEYENVVKEEELLFCVLALTRIIYQ